jgi:hypothetical protein
MPLVHQIPNRRDNQCCHVRQLHNSQSDFRLAGSGRHYDAASLASVHPRIDGIRLLRTQFAGQLCFPANITRLIERIVERNPALTKSVGNVRILNCIAPHRSNTRIDRPQHLRKPISQSLGWNTCQEQRSVCKYQFRG